MAFHLHQEGTLCTRVLRGQTEAEDALYRKVDHFLGEHKVLYCSTCDEILAIRNRKTGGVKCCLCQSDANPTKEKSNGSNFVLLRDTCGQKFRGTSLTPTNQQAIQLDSEIPLVSAHLMKQKDSCTPLNSTSKISVIESPRATGPSPLENNVNIEAPQLNNTATLPPQQEGMATIKQALDKNIQEFQASLSPATSECKPFLTKPNSSSDAASPKPSGSSTLTTQDAVQLTKSSVPTSSSPLPQTKEPLLPLPYSIMLSPVIPVPKYNWLNMSYSPRLKSGALVKLVLSYSINKYQIVAFMDNTRIQRVQEAIGLYVESNLPRTFFSLKRKPIVDEVVLAFYKNLTWYRARVIGVGEVDCTVIFIDLGDIAVNKFSDVYEITDELFGVPVLSLTFGLAGVPQETSIRMRSSRPSNLSGMWFTLELNPTLEPLKPTSALQVEGVLKNSRGENMNDKIIKLMA